jgi:hypothetical protein
LQIVGWALVFSTVFWLGIALLIRRYGQPRTVRWEAFVWLALFWLVFAVAVLVWTYIA